MFVYCVIVTKYVVKEIEDAMDRGQTYYEHSTYGGHISTVRTFTTDRRY